MEKQQILEKAIKKALKNAMVDDVPASMFSFEFETWNWHNTIFSHGFAKAFWGEERSVGEYCGIEEKDGKHCDDWDCKKTTWVQGWENHLQEMVLEEDPIKYLEKFI